MDPYFKKITIILIFIYLLYCSECFKYRQFCRQPKRKDLIANLTEVDIEETLEKDVCNDTYDLGVVDNHLPQIMCSYCENFKGRIINPYKTYRKPQDGKNIGSACLKCAACLAIAENINETFNDLYSQFQYAEPNVVKNCFCNALESICQNGFKNYDLREFEGHTLLTDVSQNSKHVRSHMDGTWTEKLRDLCALYVKNMDVNNVFNRYKVGAIKFTDYLCKGDGIFRDCNNIDVKYVKVSKNRNDITIKVCVNC